MSIETGNVPLDISEEQKPFGLEKPLEKSAEEEIENKKQQQALFGLAKRDYIQYSEDGQVICDLDKINQYNSAKGHGKFLAQIYGEQSFAVLQRVFNGLNVVSKEDWNNNKKEAKPLFYNPASDEAALDQLAIRQAKFYLTPWSSGRHTGYPNLKDIDSAEASIALLLYHPQFGDGVRDRKTNALMVKNPSGAYSKITYEFFEQYNYNPRFLKNDGKKESNLVANPTEFLQKRGKHLIENGILMPDDFRYHHRQGKEFKLATKVITKRSGLVMLDGVHYYVGKRFPEHSEVTMVNPQLALISDGSNGEVINYFYLRPDLKENNPNTFPTLNTNKTNIQPYDAQEFIQKLPEETDEKYYQRTAGVREFEARRLTKLAYEKYPEIITAADKARMFLLENSNNDEENEAIADEIIQNILARGRDILTHKRVGSRITSDVAAELGQLKADLLLFATTFKTLKETGKGINLEDFKDYQMEVTPANNISAEDQKDMESILSQNWQQQDPDLTSYALSGLYRAFSNPQSRFYVLKYREQMLGFCRFDQEHDGSLYFGSFNINPTIRGSRIGEAAMRSYIDKEANDHLIYADAPPDIPITQSYIGKFGFTGEAIKTVSLENGKTRPLIAIVRNDHENGNYRYFNDHARAVNEYQSNDYQLDQPTIILRFTPNEEKNQMLYEADRILKNGSHEMTAYFDENEYRYLVFEEKPKVPNSPSASRFAKHS